jgi:hypothetical protein
MVFCVLTPWSVADHCQRFGRTFQTPYSPWRWRQQGLPKRWYATITLHGITTQRITTWILEWWPAWRVRKETGVQSQSRGLIGVDFCQGRIRDFFSSVLCPAGIAQSVYSDQGAGRGCISGRGRYFSLRLHTQTVPGGYPASHPVGTMDKSGRGVTLTTHLNTYTIPTLPHTSSWSGVY